MLTEKYYKNFYAPDSETDDTGTAYTEPISNDPIADEPGTETGTLEPKTNEPGTVIIEEQTGATEMLPPRAGEGELAADELEVDALIRPPLELTISFNGVLYKVPRTEDSEIRFIYGDIRETGLEFDFSKYPFAIRVIGSYYDDNTYWDWILYTPSAGTYTISAKIPDGKGIPKIIKMETPKTIVNQVESIIESLGGTVDKKHRNLQNLLSTLAEMAENGEIGGGTTPEETLKIIEGGKNVSGSKGGLIFEGVSHDPDFYIVFTSGQLTPHSSDQNLVGVIYTGGESVLRYYQYTNGTIGVANYAKSAISYSDADGGTLTFNWQDLRVGSPRYYNLYYI